jgi:hypothetical protein
LSVGKEKEKEKKRKKDNPVHGKRNGVISEQMFGEKNGRVFVRE